MEWAKHKTAEVYSNSIGANTMIWQFVVILKGACIGENCNINCNVFIENDVKIGNNVTIKSGVQLWDGVTIEDEVFIGPNVTFTNDNTPRSKQYPIKFSRINIGKGASIGANSTLISPVEIGEFAFVGAGSVVTKNIPPYNIWYGNPAKHHGYITKKGVVISLNLTDDSGNKYILKNFEPIIE
jgi:acetyltransferase-like isoleucine patch superfamily enzyme